MDPFVEAAVERVLTAADTDIGAGAVGGTTGTGGTARTEQDGEIGWAALLLACVGATGESDRLVRHWRAATGRSVTRLAGDAVTARAWEMLFAARDGRPDWAAELTPLDLDAEQEAHHARLAPFLDGAPDGADPAGRDGPARAVALAEARAGAGDVAGAAGALECWAARAREVARPDLATLAACRHVAPLLVRGWLPVPDGWARDYAGALIAALHARHPATTGTLSWPELVAKILRLRDTPGTAPPPATPAGVADAERRLGVRLPREFRDFLSTCDGLPADVVFPRLLGTAELTAAPGVDAAPGRDGTEIVLSEPATTVLCPATGVVTERDPLFGATVHAGVRALLENHLTLLQAAR